MKNIIIIPNVTKDEDLSVTSSVIEKLNSLNLKPFIHRDYQCEKTIGAETYTEFPPICDLILVIGGDGTVIDASEYALVSDVPLLGINLGKMGYLSEVAPENIDILSNLAKGKYTVQNKMMLEVGMNCDRNSCNCVRLAVNDVIISHSSYLGITDFTVSDSLNNTVSYRADGIIFATPQGSSAYSLSAGGPIMAHDVEGIVATPVCPHSFFNRSIIFNDDEIMTVENTGLCDLNISIDGRLVGVLNKNSKCYVKKANKKLKMLTFSRNSLFTNLFDKMKIISD